MRLLQLERPKESEENPDDKDALASSPFPFITKALTLSPVYAIFPFDSP